MEPKLLDRVRAQLRTRHYSRRTEETYVAWIRRFILFHNKRHPSSMGAEEVNAFLTALAVEGSVAAGTQNQALSAILFLYRAVLQEPLPWIDDVIRAEKPVRVPVVLSVEEVRQVIDAGRRDIAARGEAALWIGVAAAGGVEAASKGRRFLAA